MESQPGMPRSIVSNGNLFRRLRKIDWTKLGWLIVKSSKPQTIQHTTKDKSSDSDLNWLPDDVIEELETIHPRVNSYTGDMDVPEHIPHDRRRHI